MKINVRRSDAKSRLMAHYWYRWFAWHPVKIDHDWVWLEWVQRRCELVAAIGYCGLVTTYRFIPNNQAQLRTK